MLGGKSWDEWIGQYGHSHQHPFNRLCHTVGIPLIVLSLPLLVAAVWIDGLWPFWARHVRRGMGFSVPGTRRRRQASGVLPRLALPLRRTEMVGSKD